MTASIDKKPVDEKPVEESAPAGRQDGPFPRALPWLLLIGGAIGFAAAFVLTVEKFRLLKDPFYTPSCSLNPILSCGSVMIKKQAEVFGFPNPLIGIGGFAIVATIGAGLLAGAKFRRWFWLGLQVGTTLAIVFIIWLMFQSLYSIGALCPYCMVVWAVTIPIFWYTTLHNLGTGNLGVPLRIANGIIAYHSTILVAWILLIVGLVGMRFWFYWQTLLPW